MKGHILFYDSKIKMSSENQIEIAKATKKNIVNDLCNTIDLQRQTNKGRYGTKDTYTRQPSIKESISIMGSQYHWPIPCKVSQAGVIKIIIV